MPHCMEEPDALKRLALQFFGFLEPSTSLLMATSHRKRPKDPLATLLTKAALDKTEHRF